MQKRHFEVIAEGIAKAVTSGGNFYVLKTLAKEYADCFAQWNARFDRARFMSACGFASFE